MMGTERFPETLCFLSELTRLTAREDYIATCRRESFKSHVSGSLVGLGGLIPWQPRSSNIAPRCGDSGRMNSMANVHWQFLQDLHRTGVWLRQAPRDEVGAVVSVNVQTVPYFSASIRTVLNKIFN